MTFDEFAKAVMMNTIGKAYADFPIDLKFINEDFFNAIDFDGMSLEFIGKLDWGSWGPFHKAPFWLEIFFTEKSPKND